MRDVTQLRLTARSVRRQNAASRATRRLPRVLPGRGARGGPRVVQARGLAARAHRRAVVHAPDDPHQAPRVRAQRLARKTRGADRGRDRRRRL